MRAFERALLAGVDALASVWAQPSYATRINFDERRIGFVRIGDNVWVPAEQMVDDEYLSLGVRFLECRRADRARGRGPAVGCSTPVTAIFFEDGVAAAVDSVSIAIPSSSSFARRSAFDIAGNPVGVFFVLAAVPEPSVLALLSVPVAALACRAARRWACAGSRENG